MTDTSSDVFNAICKTLQTSFHNYPIIFNAPGEYLKRYRIVRLVSQIKATLRVFTIRTIGLIPYALSDIIMIAMIHLLFYVFKVDVKT